MEREARASAPLFLYIAYTMFTTRHIIASLQTIPYPNRTLLIIFSIFASKLQVVVGGLLLTL